MSLRKLPFYALGVFFFIAPLLANAQFLAPPSGDPSPPGDCIVCEEPIDDGGGGTSCTNPTITSSGATSVCKNDNANYYFYTSCGSISNIQYSVNGGYVVSNYSNSVTIKWTSQGNRSLTASVQVNGNYYNKYVSVRVDDTQSGSVSGNTSRCGTGTESFSLSGHRGTILYWKKRYKNGSGSYGSWNTFEQTDNQTSVSTQLNQWSGGQRTYQIEAVVQNGNCSKKYARHFVTVDPSTQKGSVSGNTSRCGSGYETFSLSGHRGTIRKWKKRYKNGSGPYSSWEIFEETDNQTSVTTSLHAWSGGPRTYQIEAVIQSGNCSKQYPKRTLTVYPQTQAGTITGAVNVCGSRTESFTLSGSTGTIERWKKRYKDGTAGNWTNWTTFEEANEENVSTPLDARADGDRIYEIKALVESGNCSQKEAVHTVTVAPNAELVAGSLSGGNVYVCDGDVYPTLSLSGYAGGSGEYQLQWQYMDPTADEGDFFDISGATGVHYTLPSTLDWRDDFRYRVKVTSCDQVDYTSSQYVYINNNPDTPTPGTLTSNASGETCAYTEVVFTFNPNAGVSTYYTYLQGYYNQRWHSYGKIASSMTVKVHPDEKFRVVYDGACRYFTTTDLTLTYKEGCNMPSSLNKNFVRTEVPKVPVSGESALAALEPDQKAVSFQYQDGLGRPTQSVGLWAGPGQTDVYSFHVYDDENPQREKRKYMPYLIEGGNNGAFVDDIVTATEDLYQNEFGESKPYSETEFENASSGKVEATTRAGEAWHNNNKKKTFDTYWNTSSDDIHHWIIEEGANDEADKPIARDSDDDMAYYAANTIHFSESTNEEGLKTRTGTDLRGRKVVSQVWSGGQWVSTYTVYDDFDRVRFMIPPEAAKLAETDGTLTQAQIDGLLFCTVYDQYGRTIKSKAPGAGWSYVVYDEWDRAVLTQDASQRDENRWSFVKYDDWNREILTGVIDYGSGTSHEDLIADLQEDENTLDRYETWDGSSALGYTLDKSFPQISEEEVLTVHYFDNYDFLNLTGWPAEYAYTDNVDVDLPANYDHSIEGEATGSQVRILNTDSDDHSNQPWLKTVLYLDDDGRVIQTMGENHLGGIDRISNQYDWQGQLLAMKVDHSGLEDLEVLTTNTYDTWGNVTETYQQIDDGPHVLVAQYVYNKYGEMIEKNLHSVDDGATFLQSVDYQYSVHGWTDRVNHPNLDDDGTQDAGKALDDLYGAQYHFIDDVDVDGQTVAARYDGSMVAFRSKARAIPTDGNPQEIQNLTAFEYDDQNRLAHTLTEGGNMDMAADYDDNGNILNLNRKSDGQDLDDMTYTYQDGTNKLKEVVDNGNEEKGFRNPVDMGPVEYAYDAAGNMTEDQNKGIMRVGYNKFQRVDYIEFSDNTTIHNLYDASGNKLQKLILDGDGNEIGKVDYVGALEYVNDAINQVMTDEGRAYRQGDAFHYEYFIRDHQMNNRVAFGILPYRKVHLATLEPDREQQEEKVFSIPDHVVQPADNHTPLGTHAAALNATANRPLGPGIVLEVNSGDQVQMETWTKYTAISWNGDQLTNMAGLVAGALSGSATLVNAGVAESTSAAALSSALDPGVGHAGIFSGNANTSEPDAYLQYIFFDQDHNFQQAGFEKVTPAAHDQWAKLSFAQDFVAPMDGYLYVYVANETLDDQEVLFDDLKITHESSTANFKVSQVNDYYPFGMLTSNTWRDAGYVDPGYLYQSSYASYDSLTGYYDFLSRSYDPALGRFFAMDPAGQFSSPYAGMGNVPHLTADPTGELAWFVPIIVGAAIGGTTQGIQAANNGDSFFGGFAKGAIMGAAAGATGIGVSAWASGSAFSAVASGTASVGFGGTVAGGAASGLVRGGIGTAFNGGNLGQNLLSGAVGGAIGGMVPSFGGTGVLPGAGLGALSGGAGGALSAWATGGDVGAGFRQGALSGGLSGGVYGGIAAAGSKYERNIIFGGVTRDGKQDFLIDLAKSYGAYEIGLHSVLAVRDIEGNGVTKPVLNGKAGTLDDFLSTGAESAESIVHMAYKGKSLKALESTFNHEMVHVLDFHSGLIHEMHESFAIVVSKRMGKQFAASISRDLTKNFAEVRGYSANLEFGFNVNHYMKQFNYWQGKFNDLWNPF